MRARLALAATLALAASAGCTDTPSGQTGARAATPPPAAPTAGLVVIAPDSPQLRQIRVDTVGTADIGQDDVVAPGRVGIDPNRTSRVLLPVPGRIVAVSVRLGDHVRRGQPLVTVDSPDADAAVAAFRQAEAAARQAEAARTKAEADLQRVTDLLEHRAVAQKDLLVAQNDIAQTRAALEAAGAAREQARRRLELLGLEPAASRQPVQVRAPTSGTVLEIAVAAGEYRNDTSQPLMLVADLATVWITSEIPEAAIQRVRPGNEATISLLAYPGEAFHGRVTRIADVVDPQTRTVRVHVEMANSDGRLRPEMFGSIRHSGPRRTLPVVPPAAIVQQYGRPTVFVERAAGRFERREVTVGARADGSVAVLDGLRAGERVVVDGAVLLKDR